MPRCGENVLVIRTACGKGVPQALACKVWRCSRRGRTAPERDGSPCREEFQGRGGTRGCEEDPSGKGALLPWRTLAAPRRGGGCGVPGENAADRLGRKVREERLPAFCLRPFSASVAVQAGAGKNMLFCPAAMRGCGKAAQGPGREGRAWAARTAYGIM